MPVSDVVLACHLAPTYSFLSKDAPLDCFLDLPSIGRRFFLTIMPATLISSLFAIGAVRSVQAFGLTLLLLLLCCYDVMIFCG
jgi:hypothetical protein